jgi:hypothetical protein
VSPDTSFSLPPSLFPPSINDSPSKPASFIIHTTARTNSLPIAASPYDTTALTISDQRQIDTLLAENGFALRRDEITILDLSTIQLRSVASSNSKSSSL